MINYIINNIEFFFSCSYFHKEEGSPNELKKIYKPFDFIKLCLFYDKIFIFYPVFCNVNNNSKNIHKFHKYFKFI
jgi:hypothetical protein